MEFRDYLRLFRRRWPHILLIAAVVAVSMSASVFFGRVTTYTSSSELLLKETVQDQGGITTGSVGSPVLPLRARINLITSMPICKRAADTLQQKGLRIPAEEIRSRLQVSPLTDGNTITVSASGSNQSFPMEVVNAVCEEYKKWSKEDAQEGFRLAKKVRGDHLQQIDRQLAEKTAKLKEVNSKRVRPDLQLERRFGQILDLENQVTAIRLEQQEVQGRLEHPAPGQPGADFLPETSAGSVVAPREFAVRSERAAGLADKLSDLQARLSTLREKVTEAHPDVNALRVETQKAIESLREENQAMAEERRAALRQQRAALAGRADALDDRIQQAWKDLGALQDQVEGYQDVVEARRMLLQQRRDILTELLQLDQREALEAGPERVSIQRPAEPGVPTPRAPSTVSFPLIAIISLGVGLTGGYLLDFLHSTLRSPVEVRTYLDLPTIASIPTIREEKTCLLDVALKSPVYELYNKLSTFLQATALEQRARSLLVVSAKAGEGKSTLTSNVAIALAQAGERVILVDSDLRRPVQHQIFALDNARGMSSVLAGELEADRQIAQSVGRPLVTLDQYLQATPIPTLQVLTAGPVPMNPVNLLKSPHMPRLLSELKQRANLVLFDAPPVLGVIDGAILAGLADLTVLLIQENAVTRGEAHQFKHALDQVGANIVGVVMNKVTHQPEAYYYYYYRYRGYS